MNYQIKTDKILFTQLGNEGVVYAVEKNEYVALNETYFKILQGIEHGKSQPEIVATLCQEYDISAADCAREVQTALAQLVEMGFVGVA